MPLFEMLFLQRIHKLSCESENGVEGGNLECSGLDSGE